MYSSQIHINRKENGGCQGLGRGAREGLLFNGNTVSDLQDEKILEICFTTMNILNTTEHILKMVKIVITMRKRKEGREAELESEN